MEVAKSTCEVVRGKRLLVADDSFLLSSSSRCPGNGAIMRRAVSPPALGNRSQSKGKESFSVTLGTVKDMTILYSFPNNPNDDEISLEQTMEHYVGASLRRDGFANAVVKVCVRNKQQVDCHFSGDVVDSYEYAMTLKRFLDIGRLGQEACASIEKDEKWRDSWRFFLPHGLAMTNHRSVELLHFPPDYTLDTDRDYLASKSLKRWDALLIENGVPPEETAQYQNIIDIAPIAAPSRDGRYFQGVYSYFQRFVQQLLQHWVVCRSSLDDAEQASLTTTRPIVAFGDPVRKWIKSVYGSDVKVMEVTQLVLEDGVEPFVIVANHPSFLCNKAKYPPEELSEIESFCLLMRIMQEDLIVARWQAVMGRQPLLSPETVMTECKAYWGDSEHFKRICELTRMQTQAAEVEQESPNKQLQQAAADDETLLAAPNGPLSAEQMIQGNEQPNDRVGQYLRDLRDGKIKF